MMGMNVVFLFVNHSQRLPSFSELLLVFVLLYNYTYAVYMYLHAYTYTRGCICHIAYDIHIQTYSSHGSCGRTHFYY